jgi:hypothetical protein
VYTHTNIPASAGCRTAGGPHARRGAKAEAAGRPEAVPRGWPAAARPQAQARGSPAQARVWSTSLSRNTECFGSVHTVLWSGSGAFLPPGSRIQILDEFFPDPRSRISDPAPFWGNFLTFSSESLLCYLSETGLLIKLTPETMSNKETVCFVLLPPFYIGLRHRDPGSKIRVPGSGSDPQNLGSWL